MSLVSPALQYRSSADYGAVREAFAALEASAIYHCQTAGWRELVAEQRRDVSWIVASDAGRPLLAACVRREERAHDGVAYRVVSEPVIGERDAFAADALGDPDGCRSVALEAILDASGEWDAALIRRVRAASPWLALAHGEGVEIAAETGAAAGIGVIDTMRTPAEYWSETHKKLRRGLNNARNRAARIGEVASSAASGPDFDFAYDEFLRLEDSGWKGRSGSSLRNRDTDRGNLRRFAASATGGTVHLLALGGENIAAAVCVTVGRSRIPLKFAYDEAHAELSPGRLILAEIIEGCCEDPDIDRVDCTAWWPWQEHWAMVREPTYRIVAFADGPRADAARQGWRMDYLRERLSQS